MTDIGREQHGARAAPGKPVTEPMGSRASRRFHMRLVCPMLSVILLLAGCFSSDDKNKGVEGVVGRDGLILEAPGVGRLVVPAGAAPEGTTAAIRRGTEKRPMKGFGVEAAGPPVKFEIRAPLRRPVTVEIPLGDLLPAGRNPGDIALTYYDSRLSTWVPVPSSVDMARRVAVAQTDHVSDWRAALSRGWASVGRVLGTRSAPPSCNGSKPDWVERLLITEDPNWPMLACHEADGTRLVLRVVNNRNYSFLLNSRVPIADVRPGGLPGDVGGVIIAALRQRQGPNVAFLQAGTETTLVLERPAVGNVELRGRLDTLSTVLDIAYLLAKEIPVKAADLAKLVDCALSQVNNLALDPNSPVAVLGAVVTGFRTCVESILQGVFEAALSQAAKNVLRAVDAARLGVTIGDYVNDSRNNWLWFSIFTTFKPQPVVRLTTTSRLDIHGLGPVRAGMTVAEAERAAGVPLVVRREAFEAFEGRCYYATARGLPNVMFMIHARGDVAPADPRDGIVVRAELRGPPWRTVTGLGVGATVDQVRRVYPGRLREEPHEYARERGGVYLTFEPPDQSAGRLGLRFVSEDGSRVNEIFGGDARAIQLVEGCA